MLADDWNFNLTSNNYALHPVLTEFCLKEFILFQAVKGSGGQTKFLTTSWGGGSGTSSVSNWGGSNPLPTAAQDKLYACCGFLSWALSFLTFSLYLNELFYFFIHSWTVVCIFYFILSYACEHYHIIHLLLHLEISTFAI